MNRKMVEKSKLIIFFISVLCSFALFSKQNDNYELEKVLILSRHGLRSPLTSSGSRLSKVTPYAWEEWDVKASYLTKKGAALELYFGQYINDWLNENNLISKDKCPDEDKVLIYTNSLQRTIATGQALTLGIFPGCNINPVHKMEIGKMDPVFNPIIRTDNENFKNRILSGVSVEKENKKLQEAYSLLSEVINYKNSEECLKENKCTFYNEEGKLKIEKDKEPGVDGPLRLGTQLVDALLLEYYEGYPIEKISNNNINSDEKWKKLNMIKDSYGELLFGSKVSSRHIAYPLINYMYDDIKNTQHQVTVLVGHDSNVVSVLSALDFKDYELKNQFEKTPIGGKLFFEIWKDKRTNSRKVKIEYIYQTVGQIRERTPLNMQNSPNSTVLEMKQCKTDKDGYCPYSQFMSVLEKVVRENR